MWELQILFRVTLRIANRRHNNGHRRTTIAAELASLGYSPKALYLKKKLRDTSTDECEQGNISKCQVPSIFKRMLHQTRKSENLHGDVITELNLQRQDLLASMPNSKFNSYIQDIRIHPFDNSATAIQSHLQVFNRRVRMVSSWRITGFAEKMSFPNQTTDYWYDSCPKDFLNAEAVVQLTSLLRAKSKPNSVVFDIRNYDRQQQPMCGYYAIAAAPSICQGIDPTRQRYDVRSLYETVTRGLNEGRFENPSYTIDTNSAKKLTVCRYSKLHCFCQSPSDTDTVMVQCTPRMNWYHANRVWLS